MPGFGFNMFNIMSALFPILFVVVLGIIIFVAVRGIKQWSHNNAQPKIPAHTRVVAKRTAVSHHHHHGGTDGMHMHSSNSTSYYATFEYDSGDRVELSLPAREFGMLAEGDSGILTAQGTRFISFERQF